MKTVRGKVGTCTYVLMTPLIRKSVRIKKERRHDSQAPQEASNSLLQPRGGEHSPNKVSGSWGSGPGTSARHRESEKIESSVQAVIYGGSGDERLLRSVRQGQYSFGRPEIQNTLKT